MREQGKMEQTLSSNLFILSILLLTASSAAADNNTPHHESFIQCFLNHTPSNLIYTPNNTTAYNTVLQASAQNPRFLYSSATKKPDLIVTPTDASQVQASVVCARTHGLQLRVRSGGHDYEGLSYVSSGEPFLVLDLVNLRSITVNDDRTAWVQAGAILGELYYTINKKNMTIGFPAGICPTIGVGGHFSGGGIGTISRKYGTSADNIVDAELVDANGKLLNRKSMGEDLFWAIRGGGAASFGIVLSYKINLVYVPPKVTAFNIYKTLAQNATQLVSRWQSIAHEFDEKLFIRVVAQAADSAGSKTIQALFNSVFLGTCGELLSVMEKSFPELGLKGEDCQEMSWLESILFFTGNTGKAVESLLDRTTQHNSFKAKSDFVREPITEKGLEAIWEFLLNGKDEPLTMIMEPLGGRMSEISESAIAFPHRAGNLYNIQYYMSWSGTDATVTDKHLDWMRKLYIFMAPYVSSKPRAAYLNYKDLDLGINAKNASYSNSKTWGVKYFKDNFKRLAYVKGKVDPSNFFRNEQSIPPLIVL